MQLDPLVIEEVTSSKIGTSILRLTGPITISNLFDFQAKVRANKTPALILDVTSVPYIDSAGIGALVGAYVNHNKDHRSFALVGVNERVLNTLKITHVDRFFKRFDTVVAAEAAAG